MLKRTRQVLAVVAVTTALCADQVAVAAPTIRPQVAQFAGRVVERLTRSFSRSIASELPRQLTQRRPDGAVVPVRVEAPVPVVSHRALSPFQFRLPPPSL